MARARTGAMKDGKGDDLERVQSNEISGQGQQFPRLSDQAAREASTDTHHEAERCVSGPSSEDGRSSDDAGRTPPTRRQADTRATPHDTGQSPPEETTDYNAE